MHSPKGSNAAIDRRGANGGNLSKKKKDDRHAPAASVSNRLLGAGYVITDHTGLSMRFFRATEEACIQAVCDYHRMAWDELKQICRCVRVEIRESA